MKTGRATFWLLVVLVCGTLIGLHFLRSTVSRKKADAGPWRGRRNVYILSAPGLRPSHLSSYLYQPIQTPGIDFLAYDGIRFLNAFTTSPDSLSAHVSMLTGLYPFDPRVQPVLLALLSTGRQDAEKAALPPDHPSLPQFLQQRGYATAAFLAEPDLRFPSFFSQHFSELDCGGGAAGLHSWEMAFTPADARARAVAWITKNRERKHLVFLDFGEPTHPFRPPAPYSEQYAKHPYDGEIAAVDEQVERFVHFLKVSGLFRKSVVVFLSPFGESLEQETHTGSLDLPIIRSTLLIAAPDLLPPEKTYESAVSLIDIYPTVLELLELRPTARMDGLPLFYIGSDREIERKEVLGMTMVPQLFGSPAHYFVQSKEWNWVYDGRTTAQLRTATGSGSINPNVSSQMAKILQDHGIPVTTIAPPAPPPAAEAAAAAAQQEGTDPGRTLDLVTLLAREGKTAEAQEMLANYLRGKEASPSMQRLLQELRAASSTAGR